MRRALFFTTLAGAIGTASLVACGSSFDSVASDDAAIPDASTTTTTMTDAASAPPAAESGPGMDATIVDATMPLAEAGGNDGGSPVAVAVANGPIAYLAANVQTVGWIESGDLLRFASASGTSSGTSGATAGIGVSGVTGFAMSNAYAYVGGSGTSGAIGTNVQVYDFTHADPVDKGDFNPVTDLTTAGDNLVWDIASNGNLEYFMPPLTGKNGSGNPTGVNAAQVIGAGTLLYVNQKNTISACESASFCASQDRLFTVQTGTVMYAANDDASNANVFYFGDSGQLYGCTYDRAAPSNGCGTPLLVATAGNPGGLATVGNYVYWIDLAGAAPGVYREAIQAGLVDGGGFGHGDAERIAIGDSSTANLALNTTSVFWSTSTGTTAHTIYRLPLAP